MFSTIRKMVSGNITTQEGIRYPGRIWIGQIAQIVVSVVGIAFGAAFVKETGDSIEAEREELGRSWTQLDADKVSNKEWANLTPDDLFITPEEQLRLDALPERWQFDGEQCWLPVST